MSTETSTAIHTDEATHSEALELIDHQIDLLTREIRQGVAPEIYRGLYERLASLKKSRAALDGTTVPDFIAALGQRMANTERERRNPVLQPPMEERQNLCATPVTLNGNPARITGTVNNFATVTETKSGLSAEWSWYTVARVVEAGGRFTS